MECAHCTDSSFILLKHVIAAVVETPSSRRVLNACEKIEPPLPMTIGWLLTFQFSFLRASMSLRCWCNFSVYLVSHIVSGPYPISMMCTVYLESSALWKGPLWVSNVCASS